MGMPGFALALLVVTACGRTARTRQAPMAGDWIAMLSIAYSPVGQPTVYDEKPFALTTHRPRSAALVVRAICVRCRRAITCGSPRDRHAPASSRARTS